MMKNEIPSRRVVLRGALAVGCSLLIPTTLFGCYSKQGESTTSTAPASPATTGTVPADVPAAPGKMT